MSDAAMLTFGRAEFLGHTLPGCVVATVTPNINI